MKFSRLLLAFLVLIIVAAFFYFYEIRGKKGKEMEEKRERLLYTYAVNEIAHIELLLRGEKIELEREETGWVIKQPVEYPADSQVVEKILSALKEAKIRSFLEESENLEEYHLSPAFAAITLSTSSGERLPSIWIGDETPLRGEFFAMQEEHDGVFVVSIEMRLIRETTLYDMREKKLLPYSRWEIDEIIVERGNKKTHFRSGNGLWNVIEPIQFPADENKVADLLNALENTEVKEFIDDTSFSSVGLFPKDSLIRISCKREEDREWFSLVLGEEQDGIIYAKRSDRVSIFRIEKKPFIIAASESRDFMDRRISKRNRYNVREYIVDWGEGTARAILNDDQEWEVSETKKILDKGDSYLFLASLMETRCVDFIKRDADAEKHSGINTPTYRMIIKGDNFAEEILFSKDPSKRWNALNSSSQSVIFQISSDDMKKIEDLIAKIFH